MFQSVFNQAKPRGIRHRIASERKESHDGRVQRQNTINSLAPLCSFQTFGLKIREDRRLGSGCFGVVYACSFGFEGRIKCVIKKAKKSAEDDLILEGRVLKVIFNEPSDGRQKFFTYPFGFSIEGNGLVLERFYGLSIKQHSQQNVENNWVTRCWEIANALSFMHSRDLIHLDLHTNNILASKNSSKVIDFGKTTLKKHPITYNLDAIEREEYNRRYQQVEYELRNEKNCKTNFCSDVYSFGSVMLFITEKCLFSNEKQSGLRKIGESCCASRSVRNSISLVIDDLNELEKS